MSEKPSEIKSNAKSKAIENKKKPWSKPVLHYEGDVRTVTLGPSPGTGESASPGTFNRG